MLPAGQASQLQYRSWKRGRTRKRRMVALKSTRRFTSFWLMEHLKPQIGHNIGIPRTNQPPGQHEHQLEHSTRRVWGGVELRIAEKCARNGRK